MYVDQNAPFPMTEHTHTPTDALPDSLTHPEPFRDLSGVDAPEKTVAVDAEDFPAVREDLADRGGWGVVGLTNDAGRLLLMDDGSHGWTLPAVPVDDGDDWLAAAREGVAGLAGMEPTLAGVERVRRVVYDEDEGDDQFTVHHVVLRAAPVTGEPIADEPTLGCDTHPEVGWFDALPDEIEGIPAEDAGLFIE